MRRQPQKQNLVCSSCFASSGRDQVAKRHRTSGSVSRDGWSVVQCSLCSRLGWERAVMDRWFWPCIFQLFSGLRKKNLHSAGQLSSSNRWLASHFRGCQGTVRSVHLSHWRWETGTLVALHTDGQFDK